MRKLAAELIEAITAFDAECDIAQRTDPLDAWLLLNHIRNELSEFLEGLANESQ